MKIKRKGHERGDLCVCHIGLPLRHRAAFVCAADFAKDLRQIYDVNQIVPTSFTLENYINVLYKAKFLTYFRNSVIVAVCTTVVCMVLSICAGYGMTRYRVRGSQKLKMGILYTRMFPSVLLALPYYVIMRNLDLGDSLLGLILIYCSFTLPFTIWNMQTFFRQLPWELEEAACHRWRQPYNGAVPGDPAHGKTGHHRNGLVFFHDLLG